MNEQNLEELTRQEIIKNFDTQDYDKMLDFIKNYKGMRGFKYNRPFREI